ncbi:hypothetical protein DH2020_036993 [Rehmannia glutinosa]|uniref:FAR1 domain-containing protein n=1 Tax=Rehmannia glutinosa TaxID=99300 RepID=A0ABR0V4T3_REHGL
MEQNYPVSPVEDNRNNVTDLEEDNGDENEVTNRPQEQCVIPESLIRPGHDEVLHEKSIVEQLESKLAVGQVVKSVEDAYLLYCNYAHAKGFSVKKGDQRYFLHSKELQAKEFECSCEGVKDERRSKDRLPVYQKLITRTKCKTRLRIGREKGEEWKVTRFVIEHNHEMVAVDQTHLLRSSRNISHAQKSTLEAMVNAVISIANDVSYMENEAHGPQNLGFIRKDAYNYLDRLRKHTKVENGDASALLQYFINNLNGDSKFKSLWHKCMTYCESEEEFEATWKILIDDYNLKGHKWLNGMYKLRHKWATAFSNHKFSAGLLATSRSEGTNSVLKKVGNRTISLYDFVLNFEKIQNNWRAKEKAEDTRCRHGKPSMVVKNNMLLNHVADIYTLNIYNLFELELIDSLNTTFIEQPYDFQHHSLAFKVKSSDWDSRVRQVLFNKTFDEGKVSQTESGYVPEMVFVNQIMRSVYNLTIRCKAYDQARSMLTGILDSANQEVNALLDTLNLDEQIADKEVVDEDNVQIDEVSIRNPLHVKSRGITNAHIVRHWDAKSKKGKRKEKVDSSRTSWKQLKFT